MRGRHLIDGILYMLLGWLFQFKVRRNDSIIEVKKTVLWLFSIDDYSIDLNGDDISFIETQWKGFKTLHMIVNGETWFIKPNVESEVSGILNEEGIMLAPLIYSLNSSEPEYVLQVGKHTLYCVEGPSWEYKNVSYNVADLGSTMNYVLVNSIPIAVNDSTWEEYYISLLRGKGCKRDPFLVSPVYLKNRKKGASRYSYLLLGSEYCFQELGELKMEEIVYLDYDQSGSIHFGTGVDFYYPQLKPEEIAGIKDYFISKGAELHASGETFTTRVTYKIGTWFKKRRQSVTLGPRGVYFTRLVGKMNKTSFIPYHDFYFINPIGWRLWGRRLEIFGSQNVQTHHPFKNKDYTQILEKIYSFNPGLKESTGRGYRAFSWNPFKKKPFVLIGDGMVIHGHPKRKERVAVEGTLVKDSKKYGKFYHLFRDVVIDTMPSNLRYDEGETGVNLELFVTGTKISIDDEWVNDTENPLFVSHLWFRTAKKLMNAIDDIKGKESVHRKNYRESDQAKQDQRKKREQMAEFARRPSLVQFMKEIRKRTGCEEFVEETVISDPQFDRIEKLEGEMTSQIESNMQETLVPTSELEEVEMPSMPQGSEENWVDSDNQSSNGLSTIKNKFAQGNESIFTPKNIGIFFAGLCLLAVIIIFGIKWISGGSKTDSNSSKYGVAATGGVTTDMEGSESDGIEEGEPLYEGGNVKPDGYVSPEEYEKIQNNAAKFVNEFYSKVIPLVNNMQDYDSLIKKYFTPEFYKMYSTVDENVPDGEVGFFDFDFISNSQDPDIRKASVQDVTVIFNELGVDKPYQDATVEVLLSNGRSMEPISISLTNKSGSWKIEDYNFLMSSMREFKGM